MAEKYKKKKQKTDGEMDARELADEAVKTYKTYKRFKYQIHIALIFFIVFIYTQIQTIDPAERDTAYSYRRGISCKEARQSYSIDEASKYCEYPPESELIIKKVVGWISLAIGIAFTIQRLRRYRKENQSRK
ncbi:hypothetical protein KKF34_08060 [Myxococcota bacterium]|nr:hypothetical protein [Myxococcota bacterium]MBU1496815.1 hypothetical protein [Myxococcota bacterium]